MVVRHACQRSLPQLTNIPPRVISAYKWTLQASDTAEHIMIKSYRKSSYSRSAWRQVRHIKCPQWVCIGIHKSKLQMVQMNFLLIFLRSSSVILVPGMIGKISQLKNENKIIQHISCVGNIGRIFDGQIPQLLRISKNFWMKLSAFYILGSFLKISFKSTTITMAVA